MCLKAALLYAIFSVPGSVCCVTSPIPKKSTTLLRNREEEGGYSGEWWALVSKISHPILTLTACRPHHHLGREPHCSSLTAVHIPHALLPTSSLLLVCRTYRTTPPTCLQASCTLACLPAHYLLGRHACHDMPFSWAR